MLATTGRYTIRAAQPSDNAGLVALAAASPMEAGLTICVRRDPDFFALTSIEGQRSQVGVAQDRWGDVVGCIGVAERLAFVRGAARRTAYIGDLKVHPRHRGLGVADELTRYARDVCRAMQGGDDMPCLVTALQGNRDMERRVRGPRGLPELHRFATVLSYTIPLFLPRFGGRSGAYAVRRACEDDRDEMGCIWRVAARAHQFGPVTDPADVMAPGLSIDDYWLVHHAVTGRLAGFLACWDQHSFKRTHVERYDLRTGALRRVLNVAAPLVGGLRLPPEGAALRQLAAFQVAVQGSDPAVLHALLERAYADARARGYVALTIGLDVRDPLVDALDGFMAIPTPLQAYVTTPAGRYRGPDLGERPLHFETALV
jgi:GNAT superfamily N-acetyltransferase